MAESNLSIEQFLDLVRRSGLVDEAPLAAAVAAWPDRSLPLPEELVAAIVTAGLLTAWQVEQLRRGRHKGFVLGKYRLLGLLGRGGMSSVYLAEHMTLKNKVAIKVLPRSRVEQTSYLARFEREARTSARLNHPNIVRAFDLDVSGEIHFIAMEYVAGTDLDATVKAQGPLPLRSALDYLRQTALGLEHAHEEGLVHRDIKPANLILDARGTVKILDLGLALAPEKDDTSLTKTHDEKVLGTADYLSPEQARDSHLADARSDIYALGCTLHYLLTGRPPFAEGKLAQRIKAHLESPPPSLLDRRPEVPAAIVELYFRMLEKHPDARPQKAREVADLLAAWLSASQTAAPGPAPRRPPPRRSAPTGEPKAAAANERGAGTAAAGLPAAADSAPSVRVGSSRGGSPSTLEPASSGIAGTVPRTASSLVPAAGSDVDPEVFSRPDDGRGGGRAVQVAAHGGGAVTLAPAGPTSADVELEPAGPPARKQPAAAPRSGHKPRPPLGLPPLLWIAVAGGVIAAVAIGLAVAVSRPGGSASRSESQAKTGSGSRKSTDARPGDRKTGGKKSSEKPREPIPDRPLGAK